MSNDKLGNMFAEAERATAEARDAGRREFEGFDREIGQRLRKAREAQGLTRKQVSDWLGSRGIELGESSLAGIERGDRGLRISEAIVLGSGLLDVPVSYFAGQTSDAIDAARAKLLDSLSKELAERAEAIWPEGASGAGD